MRPEVLNPLFAPVTSLKGVGPRLAKLIERLAGPRVVDLCWHLPSGFVDRSYEPTVAGLTNDVVATLEVEIMQHRPAPRRGLPYRVSARDDSGNLTLIFFSARPDYLERTLPVGSQRIVSGSITFYDGKPQMVHPDYMLPPDQRDQLPRVEPVYPMTTGLTLKPLLKSIAGALARLPEVAEWQDPAYYAQQAWPDWRTAIRRLHAPQSAADLDLDTPSRQRLAYDELLANQLALALIRARYKRQAGRVLAGDGALRAKLLDALPYTLTAAQRRTVGEIEADMARSERMLRLLQGDVGSGKTVVALLAMAAAVEAGTQAVLMVPTEILARQHFETLSRLVPEGLLRIELLLGRGRGSGRSRVLTALAEGACDIVVGTHALFQQEVGFADLGLVVIDEQHRFGVHQRLMLAAKGATPDVLVMTATPIPRTLTMTVYGDMDTSKLDEKPPGRKPIDTRTLPLARLDEMIAAAGRAIDAGTQAFWICPLVEESETLDVAAAEERYAELKLQYGAAVGLVHGRMKSKAKDAVMSAFVAGDIKILVATTVVEVGVDVPNATVMVIEHAERFGLAQLHQLRGRIGRGERQSTCLLLYAEPLAEAARDRLSIIRASEDGFRIAEEDLRLRGTGEVLGTRQSGFPDFRLADMAAHQDLMQAARDDARLVLNRDPELREARGQALRALLYLFERDAAVKFLSSG